MGIIIKMVFIDCRCQGRFFRLYHKSMFFSSYCWWSQNLNHSLFIFCL